MVNKYQHAVDMLNRHLKSKPEPSPDERLDVLETTTDDIVLLMAELIGGE